ncbi:MULTISPECIES: SHOCT domain-containing protein [Streptacidiphilus]|uniref:SHOCT domain-containing protein n=1 Tax=Streptacidiphilus cavernicola TaxID=3342716 RepID=A0ABV6US65_9ACTN|nr:SHOCT domain-containing protein [Streptacidiphilus jeojiense]
MRPVVVRRPVGAPLLRGALIGGAAYGVGRRNARNAQQDAAQDQAIAELQAQQQTAAPAAAPYVQQPPAGGQDIAAKLSQLGGMVQQGLLTPEEFAAAKARLLGTGG